MLAYRPDDDPYTPEIITDLINAEPTNRGTYRNAFDTDEVAYTSLAATSVGGAVLVRNDGTKRVFLGTPSAIYEADQTASGTGQWSNESRVTAYATADSWSFAQLGDVSLAASYENVLQFSNGAVGTNFADVAGAPQGKIAYILNNRVILLNTQGYTGSGRNGWAASSEGDYFTSTLWPPASTNNAAYGTLTEVGGPIVAGTALGSLAIAWKRSGMWIGQDQGAPLQITWQKIPGEYGCVGLRSWCQIDGGVFFVSPQDFFIFDGSRPRPVSDGVRATFFGLPANQLDLVNGTIECAHDEVNNLVRIFLKSAKTTWIFNYRTMQWGFVRGYRGTSQETIYSVLPVSKSNIYSVNGFSNVQSAASGVLVLADDRKLRVLGRTTLGIPQMRNGTAATFQFSKFWTQEGVLYYQRLDYKNVVDPTAVTITGNADADTSAGPLTNNPNLTRMEGAYTSSKLRPTITITSNNSTSQFEYSAFSHTITKQGRA
jgi:hypothetical protein